MYKKIRKIIFILTLISTVYIMPKMLETPDAARCVKVKNDLTLLKASIEKYKFIVGYYPKNKDGLIVLEMAANGVEPILKMVPKNSWGENYIYAYPSQLKNGQDFDLYTFGPSLEDYKSQKKYNVWEKIDCSINVLERTAVFLWVVLALTSIVMIMAYLIEVMVGIVKKT